MPQRIFINAHVHDARNARYGQRRVVRRCAPDASDSCRAVSSPCGVWRYFSVCTGLASGGQRGHPGWSFPDVRSAGCGTFVFVTGCGDPVPTFPMRQKSRHQKRRPTSLKSPCLTGARYSRVSASSESRTPYALRKL